MTTRRDILLSAACVATAGAAYAFTPRRRISLLGAGRKLEDVVPRTIGDWASQDVTDLVAPKIEGSLVTKLYNQTVGRVYTNARTGTEIMALLAHGDTQSDDLQLHRPESCYPAFGFWIRSSQVVDLKIFGSVTVPSRRLVAEAPERRESIIYWSRLGEYLPLDRRQQQFDRMATAFNGNIADGLLTRFSIVNPDIEASFRTMEGFIPQLVRSVAPPDRPVLIGTTRSAELVADGV
jgi:EpsI family protein